MIKSDNHKKVQSSEIMYTFMASRKLLFEANLMQLIYLKASVLGNIAVDIGSTNFAIYITSLLGRSMVVTLILIGKNQTFLFMRITYK